MPLNSTKPSVAAPGTMTHMTWIPRIAPSSPMPHQVLGLLEFGDNLNVLRSAYRRRAA